MAAHFFLADDHALSILTDVSEDQCGPGDPLDFDPEVIHTGSPRPS